MHKSIHNLVSILEELKSKFTNFDEIKIIAVSKTFQIKDILPLAEYGHIHFGENKVQETQEKWPEIKKKFPASQLHLVGKLQSNKVKSAVLLFDYIHSLDSIKLAKKISEEQKKINKNIKIFIQINIGNEHQKSGISINELPLFYNTCVKELKLNIIGLMCLPPANLDPSSYFDMMKKAAKDLSLNELSMGMSSDYITAIKCNASFIRIGTKIFGSRN